MWPVASVVGPAWVEEEAGVEDLEAEVAVDLEPEASAEAEVWADSEAGATELPATGVWQEARPRAAKAPRRVRTFFFMFFSQLVGCFFLSLYLGYKDASRSWCFPSRHDLETKKGLQRVFFLTATL